MPHLCHLLLRRGLHTRLPRQVCLRYCLRHVGSKDQNRLCKNTSSAALDSPSAGFREHQCSPAASPVPDRSPRKHGEGRIPEELDASTVGKGKSHKPHPCKNTQLPELLLQDQPSTSCPICSGRLNLGDSLSGQLAEGEAWSIDRHRCTTVAIAP